MQSDKRYGMCKATSAMECAKRQALSACAKRQALWNEQMSQPTMIFTMPSKVFSPTAWSGRTSHMLVPSWQLATTKNSPVLVASWQLATTTSNLDGCETSQLKQLETTTSNLDDLRKSQLKQFHSPLLVCLVAWSRLLL